MVKNKRYFLYWGKASQEAVVEGDEYQFPTYVGINRILRT
jgi:Zn/Cd-binding protein ZinT